MKAIGCCADVGEGGAHGDTHAESGPTYLRGHYRRLIIRCGKTAVTIGPTILPIAHYLIIHAITTTLA